MFDTVVLKTRTGKNEEFVVNGGTIVIDGKKGARIPRAYAEYALAQNALTWEKGTGAVKEAKVYIEDDLNGAAPPKKLTEEEVKAFKRTSGLGSGKIMVDGKFVNMTSIDLDPEA